MREIQQGGKSAYLSLVYGHKWWMTRHQKPDSRWPNES